MSKRNSNNMPDGFEAPVPAWEADWLGAAQSLTSGFFAIQGDLNQPFMQWVELALHDVDFAPERVELAQFTDREGIVNTVYIAYWRDVNHKNWWGNNAVSGWWASDERVTEGVGYWREIFNMPVERFETLHSTPNSHGVANLAENLAGPVPEHAYPGAARDRIAVSATEDLNGPANIDSRKIVSITSADGKRIQLTPPDKMCVIRSGQDWGHCEAQERDFYLNEVHPTLIEGMAYLTENAAESRCLSMRLMQSTDENLQKLEQTFGLGYALDIFAFEEWAKSHPTHLKIFGTFMNHAQKFAEDMQLRLWHEVTVLQDNGGEFEYINCHQKTGLLPYC